MGYLIKVAIVGMVLAALYLLGRALRKTRLLAQSNRRLCVIESLMLSPHAAVYVLRAGTRYFLVGAGSAGVARLAELTLAEVTPEAKR
jgi:flagellar biogenesis protein FliO